MKRIITVTGAALLLVGCGQNDNIEVGGPGDAEYGSGSSTPAPGASPGGVDTGINGTSPSGNGSGGTVSLDTNEAFRAAAGTEVGIDAEMPAPPEGAERSNRD